VSVRVEHGDMLTVLGRMVAEGQRVHAIVTDPPYHLTAGKKGGTGAASLNEASPAGRARISTGFMGKAWDGGDVAFRPGTWRLCWELLPPGGYLLAFSGTRTYHRMAMAIEEAGFEIRDMVSWLYGSGFPKSHDVSKAIDKANGDARPIVGDKAVTREFKGRDYVGTGSHATRVNITSAASAASAAWEGWGTALKPACEPICLARKPLVGTVAQNVQQHGTGALNIEGCRVGTESTARLKDGGRNQFPHEDDAWEPKTVAVGSDSGRWPANVCHDGSEEVAGAFGSARSSGDYNKKPNGSGAPFGSKDYGRDGIVTASYADSGSAARFFYSAKADADDRLGSKHPTVKPVDLMRWLVRLITPPGGIVLDPFAGSGTTGMACMAEGFDCILVEREAEYVADIRRRIAHVRGDDAPLFAGAPA
jgi:DNA modification methylase